MHNLYAETIKSEAITEVSNKYPKLLLTTYKLRRKIGSAGGCGGVEI